MKFSRLLLAAFLVALTVPTAKAQQNVGPLKLDPSFANNGKSEIDFEGFNDDATCYTVNLALNRIVVAGKIYPSLTPWMVHLGVVEYDANGMLQEGFGEDGKADLTWNSYDYPNVISLLPDGSVLCAGAGSPNAQWVSPAVFRLNNNGSLDSSFGTNGRDISESFLNGEFRTIDTLRIGSGDSSARYLATGYALNTDTEIATSGFYAMRLKSSGQPDSSFGSDGQAFVASPMLLTAQGYIINGGGIMFVGLPYNATYPQIILCKLLPNGTPDSSFGTNGVVNTGITLHGGDQIQSVVDPANPSDTMSGILVAAPLADSSAMLPFTIVKFKLDGTLDSNYGLNGIATAPVISSMKIYGMTPPNIKGYTHLCGGIGNVSATVQFLPNGTVDPTFGTNGTALMDADSGLRKNFLTGFLPESGKRFLGFGTSVNAAGNDDFLVARYIQDVDGVSVPTSGNQQSLEIYPNPAHGFVTVETPAGAIEQISVVDALGRIVLTFERPGYAANSNSYFLDVSEIPNGAYSCIIRTTAGISSQRFTVIH